MFIVWWINVIVQSPVCFIESLISLQSWTIARTTCECVVTTWLKGGNKKGKSHSEICSSRWFILGKYCRLRRMPGCRNRERGSADLYALQRPCSDVKDSIIPVTWTPPILTTCREEPTVWGSPHCSCWMMNPQRLCSVWFYNVSMGFRCIATLEGLRSFLKRTVYFWFCINCREESHYSTLTLLVVLLPHIASLQEQEIIGSLLFHKIYSWC